VSKSETGPVPASVRDLPPPRGQAANEASPVATPGIPAHPDPVPGLVTATGRNRRRIARSLRPGSQLLTVLFTDLDQSTALKQRLGDAHAAEVLHGHQDLVRDLLDHFPDGHEIETAGDSFLLVFHRPSVAVEFALALQRQLEIWAPGAAVGLANRIGLHLGEVWVGRPGQRGRRLGVSGLAVNVAARVMSLAVGGQILLTRVVWDSARPVLRGERAETRLFSAGSWTWRTHGLYRLKGLEDPWEICEVSAADRPPHPVPVRTEKAEPMERP
jgi:class 3 adenylate cyclase